MPPKLHVHPIAATRTSPAAIVLSISLHAALFSALACATATSSSSGTASSSRSAAIPDPRVGLRGGKTDAAEIGWNIRRVSTTPPPEKFGETMNSDLAFTKNYAIQGNFNGYQVWDISNPRQPVLTTSYYCPGSQSDVSVYKNLLFVSGENLASRIDCGEGGVQDTVSKDRLRGVRIFDITDISKPRNVGNVQTCRGSHTHTVVEDPKDADERLCLHLGFRQRSFAEGAGRLFGFDSGQGSELLVVPHRSHQGAPRTSRTGRDRRLAADLSGSRSAASARRNARGYRTLKESS